MKNSVRSKNSGISVFLSSPWKLGCFVFFSLSYFINLSCSWIWTSRSLYFFSVNSWKIICYINLGIVFSISVNRLGCQSVLIPSCYNHTQSKATSLIACMTVLEVGIWLSFSLLKILKLAVPLCFFGVKGCWDRVSLCCLDWLETCYVCRPSWAWNLIPALRVLGSWITVWLHCFLYRLVGILGVWVWVCMCSFGYMCL